MIAYPRNPPLPGVDSKYNKILDSVDSEGEYGSWQLRVMGSLILLEDNPALMCKDIREISDVLSRGKGGGGGGEGGRG